MYFIDYIEKKIFGKILINWGVNVHFVILTPPDFIVLLNGVLIDVFGGVDYYLSARVN